MLAKIALCSLLTTSASGLTPANTPLRVGVVGGGISGITVAHVLTKSGKFKVDLFEKETRLGGNIRSLADPVHSAAMLNVGHATHLGMFINLRSMLRYLDIEERPVGRGSNDMAGLFRTLSVTASGDISQPPLQSILSLSIWWQAFVLFFYSYLDPERPLGEFLSSRSFSTEFLDILYWSMATFEFDKKAPSECNEYALGAARAYLITQIFFKYLLCQSFQGSLPSKIDNGLRKELSQRIRKHAPVSLAEGLVQRLYPSNQENNNLADHSLASYFTADYQKAVQKLAYGIEVCTGTAGTVTHVFKDIQDHKVIIETSNGNTTAVDAVVFTLQPTCIKDILSSDHFPQHVQALTNIESGAVGVSIIHAGDMPFSYPPTTYSHSQFQAIDTPPILGIFDISELTTYPDNKYKESQPPNEAGWLSIAYPMYQNATSNTHYSFLHEIPRIDEATYPWTRATPSFVHARKRIENLQGTDGIFITGHTLSGVNKASELQVTNALTLCYRCFDTLPPWRYFVPVPMLPDCNDDDAFRKARSTAEAVYLALKSVFGSFFLVGMVSFFGVEFFE